MNEFQLRSAISVASGTFNEDAWGTTARAIWVVDGATDVAPERFCPGPTDAAWFAASVGANLARVSLAEMSISAVLTRALAEVRTDLVNSGGRMPPDRQGPTASIAVASIRESEIEIGILGDCKVIAVRADGTVTTHGDSAVTRLDHDLISAVRELRQRALPTEEFERKLSTLEAQERSLANQEGGYSILDITGCGVPFAEVLQLPLSQTRSLVLLTDGFYRLVDTYRAYTDESLVGAILHKGLPELARELRHIEDGDPNCVQYPRIKPKDDATAAIFHVS